MNARLTLIPILFTAMSAFGCSDFDYECPSGWQGNASSGNGSVCSATDEHLAELQGSFDQAILGFVETIEGGCGPGDDSCTVRFIEDHEIYVYDLVALRDAGVADCRWDAGVEDAGIAHVEILRTDATSNFAVALAPGAYCITSVDSVDGLTVYREVALSDGDFVEAPFSFDHAGY